MLAPYSPNRSNIIGEEVEVKSNLLSSVLMEETQSDVCPLTRHLLSAINERALKQFCLWFQAPHPAKLGQCPDFYPVDRILPRAGKNR